MAHSFNIQFYVRASKATKNGYAPLEMSININGERKFINLPYKCLPSDFNRKRQPKELLDYMAAMRKRVNEILAQMLSREIPLTTQNLKDYIKNGGYKSHTIENLFDEYLEILRKRIGKSISKSVYTKYELVRNLFYTIVDKDMDSSAILPKHIHTFKATCEAKYQQSTTAGYLTKLKTVITYAIDNGYLNTNPFGGVKITKGQKDIEYLTEGELNYLENLRLENKSLQNVLDSFLFECYSGISFCDLKNLDANSIKEENGTLYIQGLRQKTGKEYTSVLLPNSQRLIEVSADGKNWISMKDYKNGGNLKENFFKLREDDSRGNFGKLLDINKLQKRFVFRVISNHRLNSFLHEIENLCGIKKSLTSHLGRHTYATHLANKYKCRMEVVASALGDSLKVTTKHYAKFLSETTIEEIGKSIKSVI